MAACGRISCFSRKSHFYLLRCRLYSTESSLKNVTGSSDEIIIPPRIERGPTDILKALASTISKDFTAPKYKYEDDPYCIPVSNVTKRSFALAKESGRRAARYFLETYPQYFQQNKSVPHIKAFDPPVIYNEETVSSVKDLQACISDFEVESSVTVYNILKQKGIAVDQDTQQDLLELLCYFNGKQPDSEEYYEERYFARSDPNYKERWNAKGTAETLFEEMEKTSQAYNAMIAGASKFSAAERAMSLFEEMQSKNLKASVEAYNGIISVVPILREDNASRWENIMHLLSRMSIEGVSPNLYTLNAILEALIRCRNWRKSPQVALMALAEMRKINIEPSLGTYGLLLRIFGNSDQRTSILHEILHKVENQHHEMRHPADVKFFLNAMEACYRLYGDKDLCYRVHSLLEFGNNCKLLGSAFMESLYFKFFFKLLAETEEIDKFMELYERYVPNTYTPEPSVMLHIVQAIHLSGVYRYLPRIISDLLLFEQTEREELLSAAMEAAGCMKHEEKVQKEMVHVVWNVMEKLKVRAEARRLPFDWTGVLLGDVLQTFLNGSDIQKAWSVVQKLKQEENSISGFPDQKILLKFCKLCLEAKEYDKAKYCMKYAVNSCYLNFQEDLKKEAETMFTEHKLEEKQREEVKGIFQSSSFEDTSSSSSSGSDSSDSDSSDSLSDEEVEKN